MLTTYPPPLSPCLHSFPLYLISCAVYTQFAQPPSSLEESAMFPGGCISYIFHYCFPLLKPQPRDPPPPPPSSMQYYCNFLVAGIEFLQQMQPATRTGVPYQDPVLDLDSDPGIGFGSRYQIWIPVPDLDPGTGFESRYRIWI